MTIPLLTVSPTAAAGASASIGTAAPSASPGLGFGDMVSRALDSVETSGHAADSQATQAIMGKGNLTEVVTAVSQAELALQSAVAIRDRVVQAYQEVMRMPI